MPFTKELSEEVYNYCSSHIPNDEWYQEKFFPFITDQERRERIIIEHKNARFIYKLFEGLQAKDEQLLAQIKTQVIMFVSIQEEVVNYILFDMFKNSEEVSELGMVTQLKRISIPETSLTLLKKVLVHDSKTIIPCFSKITNVQRTKIRYDQKVNALAKMGLIDEVLTEDLIELYEYRNTIHLEAERKKRFNYDLKIGELAYRRVEGLSIQIENSLKNLSLK